jgi:hypothetical protein
MRALLLGGALVLLESPARLFETRAMTGRGSFVRINGGRRDG